MSKKTILIIVLVIAGVLILAGGGYFGYRYWQNRKVENQQEIDEANGIAQKDEDDDATDDSEMTNEEATQNIGWALQKNFQNNYSVEYPKDAIVEDLSDPTSSDITYSKCLKISTDNYYVLIGTAPGEDDIGTCFRTGVGSDWTNGPTETVTAAGMEYTTTGMHSEAASAGYYRDFFSISPVDGRVKIEYGIDVNEKYGTISKEDAKGIVHRIVASYSPAE